METGRDAFGIRSLNRHTLEQIVSASSAGVLVADASHPELPIVYANAAYEKLTGYTLGDLAGHPWAPLAFIIVNAALCVLAGIARPIGVLMTLGILTTFALVYALFRAVRPAGGLRL